MKENEMIFGIRAIIEAIHSDKQIDKIIRALLPELLKKWGMS